MVRGVLADMELSGASEAAREVFEGAIKLFSAAALSPQMRTTAEPGEPTRPGGIAVSAATEHGASGMDLTASDDGSVGVQASSTTRFVSEQGKDGGVVPRSMRDGDQHDAPDRTTVGVRSVSTTDGAANSASALSAALEMIPPRAATPTVVGHPLPLSSSQRVPEAARDARNSQTYPGGAVSMSATDVTLSGSHSAMEPLASTTTAGEATSNEKACAALESLLRGLESRFLERVPLTPTGVDVMTAAGAAAVTSPTATKASGGIDSAGGQPEGKAARTGTGGGWSFRVSSRRAEEVLAELLEREKELFTQTNQEGARAHKSWEAGLTIGSFPSPTAQDTSFEPLAHGASATGSSVAAATVTTVGDKGAKAMPATAPPGAVEAPGAIMAGCGVGGAEGSQQLSRQHQRHYPLDLSGSGLGGNASVFAMMVRSGLILGRHEMAVLLTVRCAEHFLDVADLLASPRGPLSERGGGKGGRAAGRSRTEGLGAVALLLTSQEAGAERRTDAATTSACCEFLAHALATVVLAIPHEARRQLFGGDGGTRDSGKSAAGRVGTVAASARRTSVLRCLSRLTRYSMDTDNIRVSKNLS